MTSWIPDLSGAPGPAYLALADMIAAGVATGRLSPGDRLPTQREMAYRLGLSLNTVTRAYSEAVRRGVLEGTVGRGTFVRRPTAARSLAAEIADATLIRPAGGPVDFARNLPFRGAAAAAALSRTLADLSRSPGLGAFLDHQPDTDSDRHAEVGAEWIGTLGLGPAGRCVVLTNGAQQGLFVALLALTRPGDAILVEELAFPPLLSMARHLGLQVLPVALDDDGIRPEALDELCRTTAARVLCCAPTLHTPTGLVMSVGRRQAIAGLAERHGLTVVEDDVFGFLPRTRPAPLAAHAPDRSILVTSVSKSFAAGLRVGYLHAPIRLQGALRSAVALSSWMPPPLMAEIATRWIEDGTGERLTEAQRTETEHRQALARDVLARFGPQGEPSGFHLWLPLPERWRADDFEAAARRSGVELRSGTSFTVDNRARPPAVRLCLSHELDRDRVRHGLMRVAELLVGGHDEDAFVV